MSNTVVRARIDAETKDKAAAVLAAIGLTASDAFRLMMEVIGPASYLRRGSPEALLRSRLERNYRSLIILTFGGGVNEVQRDLIAMFSLVLPRADR